MSTIPIQSLIIDNDTDMFEPVIQNINDLKPLETLLAAIATTDKLLINEDSEISPLIYATFRNIFSLYKFDKALASKATENIKAVVARYPSDNRQATWLKIIDLLNNN